MGDKEGKKKVEESIVQVKITERITKFARPRQQSNRELAKKNMKMLPRSKNIQTARDVDSEAKFKPTHLAHSGRKLELLALKLQSAHGCDTLRRLDVGVCNKAVSRELV